MNVPTPRVHIHSPNHNALREPRVGVMLHYFGSRTDSGALSWASSPQWRASYNAVVLDDGGYAMLVDWDRRAWHAGVCKPSDAIKAHYKDANSAFYGIAAACGPDDPATPEQVVTMAKLCEAIFAFHGWHRTWRVTTHSAEAWPRGRKVDPEGPRSGMHYPIFTRERVVRLMDVMK